MIGWRYVTAADMPDDWDDDEATRPDFDDDGGTVVPGLGYRRWTFAEHETYARKLHDLHQPVITAEDCWHCADLEPALNGMPHYAVWLVAELV